MGSPGAVIHGIKQKEKDELAFQKRESMKKLFKEIERFDEEHAADFEPLLSPETAHLPGPAMEAVGDFPFESIIPQPRRSGEVFLVQPDCGPPVGDSFLEPDKTPLTELFKQSLREAYQKALDKLEDARLMHALDLDDFADDTVGEAADRVYEADKTLKKHGIDPKGVHKVTNEVTGVVCID